MKYLLINIIFVIFIGVISFSCLPISLNPAHNSEQVFTDSTLIGKWEVCSNDSNSGFFELEWFDSVTYLIKTKNDVSRDSVGVSYLGQLTNIEGNLILSYTTSKETIDTTNHIYNMFIPGYYFILIKKVNRDSLHFNILNLEVLGEYLEKPFGGIKKIKHNDNYLIVDSPEKVRKFIKKCLKHPEILTFERSTFGFDSIILRRL